MPGYNLEILDLASLIMKLRVHDSITLGEQKRLPRLEDPFAARPSNAVGLDSASINAEIVGRLPISEVIWILQLGARHMLAIHGMQEVNWVKS